MKKLITSQFPYTESNSGIYEYFLDEHPDEFDYYIVGYPSSTERVGDSSSTLKVSGNFTNVYKHTQDGVDWWSNDQQNEYFEMFFLSNTALQITNYSFTTYGGTGPEASPCGLVDWKIDYYYNEKIVAEKLYHSNETDYHNKTIFFSTEDLNTPLITRFKLTMTGPCSRGEYIYYLTLRRFEVYGHLFKITLDPCTKNIGFYRTLFVSHILISLI